jgi:glycogen synthase
MVRRTLPTRATFLAGLDVFAMISEPSGCPNASLEALAAGVPVIATDVGGAREQVIDGKSGRLVPARDASALANAIVDSRTIRRGAQPLPKPVGRTCARTSVSSRCSTGTRGFAVCEGDYFNKYGPNDFLPDRVASGIHV